MECESSLPDSSLIVEYRYNRGRHEALKGSFNFCGSLGHRVRRANAAPEWQTERLGWRSRELVAACPLKGLVGRPSSLKKAAPLIHLWFVQYHEGFWKATQVPEFHQHVQGLQ